MRFVCPLVVLGLNALLSGWLTESVLMVAIAFSALGIALSCTHGGRVPLFLCTPAFLAMLVYLFSEARHLESPQVFTLVPVLLVQAGCLGWMASMPLFSRSEKLPCRLCNLLFCSVLLVPVVQVLCFAPAHISSGQGFLAGAVLLVGFVLQLDNCPNMDRRDRPRQLSQVTRIACLLCLACVGLLIGRPVAVSTVAATEGLREWVGAAMGREIEGPTLGDNRLREVLGGLLGAGSTIDPNLELQQEYDLDLPHTPVMHVRFHDPRAAALESARFYVRTGSLVAFSGNTWSAGSMESAVLRDADDGVLDERVSITVPGSDALTCTLFTVARPGGRLATLSQLNSLGVSVVVAHTNGQYTAPITSPSATFSYELTFTPETLLERSPMELAQPSREMVQLPGGGLAQLIQREAEKGVRLGATRYDQLTDLVSHFSTDYTYSLTTDNPDDLPPLENFLTVDRKGHCELFASAFVLCARSLGIPARLCVGYAGGEVNLSTGMMTVFADNGHAWAEVQTADGVWRIVDPTPADSTIAPGPLEPVTTHPQWVVDDFPLLNTLLSDAGNEGAENSARAGALWLATLERFAPWALVIALVVGVIVMIVAAFRNHGASERVRGQRISTRSPTWFESFCRFYSKRGCRRQSGQTVNEYMADLKQRGLIGAEYDDMADYLNAISYTDREPSREDEKRVSMRVASALRSAD